MSPFKIESVSQKGIDYEKLLNKFGCFAITDDLKARIHNATGMKPHRFIRRDIFFCHRDLELILNRYE